MADLMIPDELAQLQARDGGVRPVQEHHRGVGVPVLEWPEDERARSRELTDAATAAADELHTAVAVSGLVAKHGLYIFQAALMEASRSL